MRSSKGFLETLSSEPNALMAKAIKVFGETKVAQEEKVDERRVFPRSTLEEDE